MICVQITAFNDAMERGVRHKLAALLRAHPEWNLEQLTADLGTIARANRDSIETTMVNVEELTAALNEAIPRMIEEYRGLPNF